MTYGILEKYAIVKEHQSVPQHAQDECGTKAEVGNQLAL